MQFRLISALAVMVFTGGLASAQPKDAGPTIELRLRSVNDLVARFEYAAGLVGKEDAAKQVSELIKVLSADGKGIEGIDPRKPIGAYATLVKEIETSPFVIMIPIADEGQLLKALKTRLDVTPEKNTDGTLKVAVPLINELHLRFTNGYLFVSPKAKDLDPKALVKPSAYFAADDGAVASVVVHIDRIPADLKTLALGQFELSINEGRKKDAERESAAEKQLKKFLLDNVIGGAKGLVDDGKDLSIKFFVDPKTDAISVEVSLSAKNGTAMAKNIAALGGRPSLPAGIVASTGESVARGGAKLAVTEGMRKDYTAAVDALLADAVKKAKPEEEAILKQLVDAVSPTLKAGELDAAAALTGPDAKGRYQLIAAVTVTDGKKIEKFAKDLAALAGGAVDVTFDVEKVGDFSLHRVNLPTTDEKFEKVFGTKEIWAATSDKCIALSVEPDGKTIRSALKAKAAPVPVASVDVSVAKLIPLVQPDLKPDELKALLKDAFGDGPVGTRDRASLVVSGGNQLTAKFQVSGKTVRLGVGLDVVKGK